MARIERMEIRRYSDDHVAGTYIPPTTPKGLREIVYQLDSWLPLFGLYLAVVWNHDDDWVQEVADADTDE